MSLQVLRQQVVETARAAVAEGLNHNAAGNVSVRGGAGFLITPSGVPYDRLSADGVVEMTLDGVPVAGGRPSSEWRFHRDIYVHRDDAQAVVHAHAPQATTVACLGRDVPPFHYMVAVAGGDTVRCAPYATFGTQQLADAVVTALAGRKACLMAHHGLLTLGCDLSEALAIAVEIESLCGIYCRLLQISDPPPLLPTAEMARVQERFKVYGRDAEQSQTPAGD